MKTEPEQLTQQVAPTNTTDADEALDEAAQGENLNADDTDPGDGEIDAAGAAAGLVSRDEKPFRGIEEVERRDDRRWELDPKSKDEESGN
jgi:Family of unknown function (DUF6335)